MVEMKKFDIPPVDVKKSGDEARLRREEGKTTFDARESVRQAYKSSLEKGGLTPKVDHPTGSGANSTEASKEHVQSGKPGSTDHQGPVAKQGTQPATTQSDAASKNINREKPVTTETSRGLASPTSHPTPPSTTTKAAISQFARVVQPQPNKALADLLSTKKPSNPNAKPEEGQKLQEQAMAGKSVASPQAPPRGATTSDTTHKSKTSENNKDTETGESNAGEGAVVHAGHRPSSQGKPLEASSGGVAGGGGGGEPLSIADLPPVREAYGDYDTDLQDVQQRSDWLQKYVLQTLAQNDSSVLHVHQEGSEAQSGLMDHVIFYRRTKGNNSPDGGGMRG